MSFELFSNLVGAFFTLCIFSFLYKDNPFYQMSEQLLVGVSLGYSVVLTYERVFIPFFYQPIFLKQEWINSILVQMRQAMVPIENVNLALIFIGTIAVLLYFFFSKAHTGAYGKFVDVGKWYMMVGFGASFGLTVMARISLLIGRIQFLVNDVFVMLKQAIFG
jgi:hypothetical protein